MKKFAIYLSLLIAFIGFSSTRQTVSAQSCADGTMSMHIVTRDADGKLIPNINFAIYTETKDADNKPFFDERYRLAAGKTDDGGQSDYICLDVKKYPYAVKLWENNPTYGYFSVWSEEIAAQYYNIEVKMSDLFVIIRDGEGGLVKNSIFDVFVQGFDVDNKPIIDETNLNQDKLVVSQVNTGDVGGKHLYLAPGNYVVRMYATGGKEFFYVWNQKNLEKQRTTLDYKQGTLRTTLEDGNGSLVKDQSFYIHKQKYDAQNNPITGDLIIAMQTGSTGKADAYLPAGEYAIKIPSANGNLFYYVWKVKVNDESLTDIKYRLSGLRVILRDVAGEILRNGSFNVTSQKKDALGQPVADVVLASANTGDSGFKDVYLPSGTYVLTYNNEKLYQIDVADTYFTKVDWGKSFSARLHNDVAMSHSLKNLNLTLRKTAAPKIKKLNKFSKIISTSFKIEASRIESPTMISFYYTEEQLQKKKVKAEKMAIAFYNQATRKWQYVGKNYPSKKMAAANIKGRGIIVLVAKK